MNTHAPEFVATIRRLLPLLQNYPPYSVLRFESLCDWVAFYWNRGTISYVIDQFGEPEAVCVIKLFRELEQFMDPFIHEPCNQFCMIEVMIARTPNAMAQICDQLTRRWGPQSVIMWDRHERTEEGCPRMYRWDQFQKLARRITYGVVEMKGQ